MDQMQAIWSALDEMLEKSPEKYQEFIASQLKQGRSMVNFVAGGGMSLDQTSGADVSNSIPGRPTTNTTTIAPAASPNISQVKNESGDKHIDKKDNIESGESSSEATAFTLKLPQGVEATKIGTNKKVLIEEISSTVHDEDEDD